MGRFAVLGGPLIAALLGLATIGGRSLAADEAFSWGISAQEDLGDFWDGLRFVSGNMGAYLVALRGMLLFGDGIVVMRLASLAFFVATVWMLARLALRWFDARTALFVSLLAATSVPLLYYGIEMRGYSLVGLASVVVWSQLDHAVSTDRWKNWIGLGLASGIAVSAHVLTIFMLPPVAVLALVHGRHGFVNTAIRLVPMAVGVLPTAVLLALGDGANTQWIPPLGPTTIAQAGRFLLGDHAQFTSEGSGFAIAAIFVGLYALALVQFAARRNEWSRNDAFAWTWLLTMPVALVLLSLVQPYLWHRYLMPSLPGGLLVVAHALSRLRRQQVAVGVVVVLAVLGTVRTMALRPHSSDSYGQLVAELEERAVPGDSLVVTTPWTRAGMDYYWRDASPVLVSPGFGPDFDMAREVERLDRGPRADRTDWIAAGGRIWVVDRSDSSQRRVEMERTDDDFDFRAIEASLPGGYELTEEFDVQRFRVRLYSVG